MDLIFYRRDRPPFPVRVPAPLLAESLERVLLGDPVESQLANPVEHARRYWPSNWTELWKRYKDDVIRDTLPARVRCLVQDLVDLDVDLAGVGRAANIDTSALCAAVWDLHQEARDLVLQSLSGRENAVSAHIINALADKLRDRHPSEAQLRPGIVYLIRFAGAPRDRQYKVGFSSQLNERTLHFARAYPFESSLLATAPGSLMEERLAHWIFEPIRFSPRREFFAADRRIERYFKIRAERLTRSTGSTNDAAA